MRLLGLLAVTACASAATPSLAAAASTGGAGAPGTHVSAALARKVRPSGIATWFGPGFYGNETACGQTLTPGVIGVANRTLPCGTLVKVTYKGRSLMIPVLDRGPYSNIGADWDLTSGAAEALGITETVRIGTRIVGAARNTATLGLPPASATASIDGGALAG
jgi:rare lipoprotein A (peptidoglycan hydrolase)